MRVFLPFFAAFAAVWCLQLYATAKQGQHFMKAVSGLRSAGETAIGASSLDRMKRRSYVALASDETDLVTGAVELSGMTVFARATPVPELIGVPLRDLAESDAEDRRSRASRMAARALLGMEMDVPERVAARQQRRWGRGPGRGAPGQTGGGARHRQVARTGQRQTTAGHLPSRRTEVRDDGERGGS